MMADQSDIADRLYELTQYAPSDWVEVIAVEALAEIKQLRALTALKPAAPPAEQREEIARIIYNAFPYDGPDIKPVWLSRGNSLRQDDARRAADAVITALQSDSEVQQLRRIRALLIKALAIAIGRPEDDEALLEAPVTMAQKFRALIADKRAG